MQPRRYPTGPRSRRRRAPPRGLFRSRGIRLDRARRTGKAGLVGCRSFPCANNRGARGLRLCRSRSPFLVRFCGSRPPVSRRAGPRVLCYIKRPMALDADSIPVKRPARHDSYLVKSLVHASEILLAFHHPGEGLRLRDVMHRTGFGKGMCFRLLYTLRHCGFLEKVENNRYRLTAETRRAEEVPDRVRGPGPGQLVRARGAYRPGPGRRA